MKRRLAIVVIGVVLLLGLSGDVRAEENGYVLYEMEDCGTICYDFGEWGYCQDSCEEEVCPTEERTPRSKPTNTDAPEATPTDVPSTATPTDDGPTPMPNATPKLKCDQGRGNGDDGCSPGNSDRNHNPNDPQRGPR